MIKFLDLNKQYLSIKDEIDSAISSVIHNSAFIGGINVKQFEEKFAIYLNAENCISVGNGTDALEIAIESLNLPTESEIIVPSNSFIASSEAITRSGNKVVFCNSNSDDYTIDVRDVEKRITGKTAAVIAVHLYGHPCDMDPLINIAKKHKLRVIEDCAQAHGAEYKNRKVGNIGDIGTFSFYPGKNLGAYGDGGAIITNSSDLARKCRMIANHGRLKKYDHEFEGRNSRLDGLQAAILSTKLKYIDNWNNHRIQMAELYLDKLKDIKQITLPKPKKWAKQVFHLFVIRVNDRVELIKKLNSEGIQTGIHYPISLHKLEAYRYLNYDNGLFNEFDDKLLSLPMGDHLRKEDVLKISEILHEWYK